MGDKSGFARPSHIYSLLNTLVHLMHVNIVNLYVICVHTDIDECRNNTDNCTQLQECTNTAGSFMCSCITGYRSSTTSPLFCAGKHTLQYLICLQAKNIRKC